MKLNHNIFIILFSFLLLIFISCESKNSTVSKQAEGEDSWVGTFKGRCATYNMENQYGEPMVIYGNYVTIPAVDYSFKIYDEYASIYMNSEEGDNYSCHNVYYSVSSNSGGFSLTMMPEAGSDCGGDDIILTGDSGYYNIERGTDGQPSYLVYKKD